jgi:hypothetical protein
MVVVGHQGVEIGAAFPLADPDRLLDRVEDQAGGHRVAMRQPMMRRA